MKVVIKGLAVLAAMWLLTAAGIASAGGAAEHDFGKIPRNQEVAHVFAIENHDDDTLFVESVEAG